MKSANTILTMILLVMAGCGRGKLSTDGLITVDVTSGYPKKELMLQDFMVVEYISLETTNEFICQGVVLDIGKDIVIVKNHVNDGDIFIFNRTGKGLRKINRMGQGGEEYTFILDITLDEDNNEMFVNDHTIEKILVYDLYGNYKRSIRYRKGSSFEHVHNYDKDHLICYDFNTNWQEAKEPSHYIISKQDGSIVKEIEVPFEKAKSTILIVSDPTNEMMFASGCPFSSIIPHRGNWIIVVPSSDTVYRYLPDHSKVPFIVRTPSIQTMDPDVFLFPGTLSEQYYFMESVKKEYNFETKKGFPGKDLMYDRHEKTIFEYVVYNDDYSKKTSVPMVQRNTKNDEIAFWQKIEADNLFEAHAKGELKGKLKDIAAELEEESNPVIMLVKHRKIDN